MAHVTTQPVSAAALRAGFLSRHLPSRDQLLRSEAVWLALMLFLVVVKILSDTVIPVTFRSAGQQSLFTWEAVITIASLGLVGIWCARATGFAAAWDVRVTSAQRLLLPFAIGLGIGAVAVGIDVALAATPTIARALGQPSFNIDFPGSLLAYFGGGIEVETEYRLFSLPLLVWLISSVLLRGRGRQQTLWVIGAFSAAYEPATQGGAIFVLAGGVVTPLMLAGYLVTSLSLNILAVVFFLRYGLLAPIALRWGDYLVWHIFYGNFLYGLVFPS